MSTAPIETARQVSRLGPIASPRWRLVWPILALLVLPLAASWFVYANHLPPGFGVFPPLKVAGTPPFNLLVFLAIGAIALGVAALYLVPRWFGFAPPKPWVRPVAVGLPLWFWLGLGVMALSWWLMWARPAALMPWVVWAFTPLWWGFIFVLDGLCFRFSGGYSLWAKRRSVVLASALVSVAAWWVFEYLDYFLLGNWYYPNAQPGVMPALSHTTIVWMFLLAYSTVWPAVFEIYVILATCTPLAQRYVQGPRWLPGVKPWVYIALGLLLCTAMVVWPYPLFFSLWVAPILCLAGALASSGFATPITRMSGGDWSQLLLLGLASLLTGFAWEFWNYGSMHPALPLGNPNYWVYEVPYINVIHLFSEMPLLGYVGYLPFGIVVWLVFAWVLGLFGRTVKLLPGD